ITSVTLTNRTLKPTTTSTYNRVLIRARSSLSENQPTGGRHRKLSTLILATQQSPPRNFLCTSFISAPLLPSSIPAAPAQYLHQQRPPWLHRRHRTLARRLDSRISRLRERWCKLPRAVKGPPRIPSNTWDMTRANLRSESIGRHQTQSPA